MYPPWTKKPEPDPNRSGIWRGESGRSPKKKRRLGPKNSLSSGGRSSKSSGPATFWTGEADRTKIWTTDGDTRSTMSARPACPCAKGVDTGAGDGAGAGLKAWDGEPSAIAVRLAPASRPAVAARSERTFHF